MKKIYLIANWKMQLLDNQAIGLASKIILNLKQQKILTNKIEIVLCPSFTSLIEVQKIVKNSQVKLGAQDVSWFEKGSYTGEVSAEQLKKIKVDYVIIGHSERRKYFKETDEEINKKIKIALANKLIPIVCVGETLIEKQAGQTKLVLARQIKRALAGVRLKKSQSIIIAYEPVWAIGSGKSCSVGQLQEVTQSIYQILQKSFSQEKIKNNIFLIYGGSVNAKNIGDILGLDLIQGVLVGTASLKADKFIKIIKNAIN